MTSRCKALAASVTASFCLATLFLLGMDACAASPPAAPERTIAVDYARVKGPTSQVFRQCVGAGRANEGLRADWQRQLAYTQRECGFQYIRMHGLFTDDMGVYSEDKAGRPVYNWQYVDRLYDFLLSIHVRPFVELGFMPGALASGRQTIFWWRGNVTPPKDYDKWRDLVAAAVRHWTERYGQEEVKNWYFEVWNEPNLKGGFWTGDQQDYFKLYAASAAAVKSVSPQYRVGGPATAGNGWITDFIRYCADNHVPVDFVSTHTYGVGQGFWTPTAVAARSSAATRTPSPATCAAPAPRSTPRRCRACRCSTPSGAPPTRRPTPSTTTTSRRPISWTRSRTPRQSVSGMSYWTFTDIFEEAGPRATPFHGGFGLINYEDILKPAFFAYRFLNRTGADGTGEPRRRLLRHPRRARRRSRLCSGTSPSPSRALRMTSRSTKRTTPPDPRETVALRIAHLPAGRYTVRCTRVGYRANDPYATYMDLGSPGQLTRPQVALIKRKNSGAPFETRTVAVAPGRPFHLRLPLRENDVYFVTLTKDAE